MELKEITVKEFKWIKTGDADFATIKQNFYDVAKRLNETIREVNGVMAQKDTFMRTVLVDSTSPVTIIEGGNHSNLKIVSGFAMLADNLKMDQTISIENTKGQSFVEPKTLKASEKSGKAQSLEVIGWRTIGKFDDVVAVPSSVRKAVVSILLEEI